MKQKIDWQDKYYSLIYPKTIICLVLLFISGLAYFVYIKLNEVPKVKGEKTAYLFTGSNLSGSAANKGNLLEINNKVDIIKKTESIRAPGLIDWNSKIYFSDLSKDYQVNKENSEVTEIRSADNWGIQSFSRIIGEYHVKVFNTGFIEKDGIKDYYNMIVWEDALNNRQEYLAKNLRASSFKVYKNNLYIHSYDQDKSNGYEQTSIREYKLENEKIVETYIDKRPITENYNFVANIDDSLSAFFRVPSYNAKEGVVLEQNILSVDLRTKEITQKTVNKSSGVNFQEIFRGRGEIENDIVYIHNKNDNRYLVIDLIKEAVIKEFKFAENEYVESIDFKNKDAIYMVSYIYDSNNPPDKYVTMRIHEIDINSGLLKKIEQFGDFQVPIVQDMAHYQLLVVNNENKKAITMYEKENNLKSTSY